MPPEGSKRIFPVKRGAPLARDRDPIVDDPRAHFLDAGKGPVAAPDGGLAEVRAVK